MTTVILAEKPSQARAYVDAFQSSTKKTGYYEVSDPVLPTQTKVTFGFGHLVEMATPDKYDAKYKRWSLKNLPIFPDKYKFIVPAKKRAQFNIVKDLLKQADTIIIATDSDREGENIAWSILEHARIGLKQKRIQRLWINSLETAAILAGFQNLRDGWDYYSAYKEAQTRQISDWLVGMNGSPLYTLLLRKAGVKGVYSIGRVQTPTLYMVYQREQAIKNFQPEPYLELNAQITTANKEQFTASLEPHQRFKDEPQLQQFLAKQQVQFGPQSAVIKDVRKQAKKTSSPRLFSLSSLQSAINQRYHASASQTLKAAQALYEAKLLTYPRTDCNYLTNQEFNYLAANLQKYARLTKQEVPFPDTKPQARYVNGAKVQEHHAIIMTKTVPTLARLQKLPRLQQQVYNLVLRTTLGMFAGPYQYEETTVHTQVGHALFKAVGKVPTVLGWKALFPQRKDTGKEAPLLPAVQSGQAVTATVKSEQKMTQPPAAFTEGTLITAMKTAGKTLDDQEAQAILKDTEGIGTEATRANILEVLKKRGYLIAQKNQLHVSPAGNTLCTAVELEPLLTSPAMTAKWEVALKQIGQKQRTPENFLSQIQKFIQKLLTEVPEQLQNSTNLSQQVVQQKELTPPAPKETSFGTCPLCQQGKIVDKGKVYGCTNYHQTPACKFILPKRWSSKLLPKTAVKALVATGETAQLQGFKSKKTGHKFAAKLKLVDGKLQFVFSK